MNSITYQHFFYANPLPSLSVAYIIIKLRTEMQVYYTSMIKLIIYSFLVIKK